MRIPEPPAFLILGLGVMVLCMVLGQVVIGAFMRAMQ
jgi:hypothetical protein